MGSLVCSSQLSCKASVLMRTSRERKHLHKLSSAVSFSADSNFVRLFNAKLLRAQRFQIQLQGFVAALTTMESRVASVQEAVPTSNVWSGHKLACTLIPVVLTVAISKMLSLGLEMEVLIATIRSTAQLASLGLALKAVFEEQHVAWCIVAMMAIVIIAGQTSGERAKALPRSKTVATIALVGGAFSTVWLMVLFKVVPVEPKSLIPATGFCIGTSMSAVSTTLKTIANDVQVHEPEIEAALALGATPHQAVKRHLQRSLILALGPICDHLKVAGLVTLPGSMVGMLMSGSQPMEAVRSSLMLLYMVLGSASLTVVLGAQLGWRSLFTSSMQVVRAT